MLQYYADRIKLVKEDKDMKYKKRGRRVKKVSIWKRIRRKFKRWFKKLSKPKKKIAMPDFLKEKWARQKGYI